LTDATSGLEPEYTIGPSTKPLRRFDETVLKQTPAINARNSKTGCVKMIEAVTAILALFSAGIFVAHAVDAYRAA
jgi:hypothetical protein